MPTKNRRAWIKKKAQIGFKEKKNLTDSEDIDFHIRLAETHLESVKVQSSHLQLYIDDEPRQKGEFLFPMQKARLDEFARQEEERERLKLEAKKLKNAPKFDEDLI
eukprot:TRINITY_DN3670_c0_g1_i1.p1 TRINITY_DN3670_c0_g1~~TRINITY_DN3670_c0_g1_i1.p1  ORF type:complete len:106 (-),score=31.77 TRINITY_DN3670_c0_g1_i1:72-389(-)